MASFTKPLEQRDTRAGGTLFWIVFIALILLHAGIILSARFFPFVDLPIHLAFSTQYQCLQEPGHLYGDYYFLDRFFGQPNFFYTLFCAQPVFASVMAGHKVFMLFYIILLPLSVWALIRSLGGDPWYSLFAFLYIYNYSLMYGFMGFAASLPFVFLILAVFYRHLNRKGWLWPAALAALLCILYSTHLVVFGFTLAVLSVMTLVLGWGRPKELFRKGLGLLPGYLLLAQWILFFRETELHDESRMKEMFGYFNREFLHGLWQRKDFYLWDQSFLYPGRKGYWIAVLFALALFLTAVCTRSATPFSTVWKRIRRPAVWILVFLLAAGSAVLFFSGQKDFSHLFNRFGFFLFFGLAFLFGLAFTLRTDWQRIRQPAFFLLVFILITGLAIVLLPQTKNFYHSYFRFSVFLCLGLVAFFSLSGSGRMGRVRVPAAVAACVVYGLLWFGYFMDFKADSKDLTPDLFPEAEKGRALAGLIYDSGFRGKPVYKHFANYYIVWKQGLLAPRTLDIRNTVYAIRPKPALLRFPVGFEGLAEGDRYRGQFRELDYILVRGGIPENQKPYFSSHHQSRSSGRWRLFQKNPAVGL
ncbi:hypothetical protein JW906_00375 [bacterium]|nr:hypothetical protein [bacterium]